MHPPDRHKVLLGSLEKSRSHSSQPRTTGKPGKRKGTAITAMPTVKADEMAGSRALSVLKQAVWPSCSADDLEDLKVLSWPSQ